MIEKQVRELALALPEAGCVQSQRQFLYLFLDHRASSG